MNDELIKDIIINYLKGENFEYEEVLFACNCLENNLGLILELIPKIQIHYEIMQNEALDLYNILNKDYNKEYLKLIAYKKLPYKNNFNIYIDVLLFKLIDPKLRKIDLLNDYEKYEYLINCLLENKLIKTSLIKEFFQNYHISYIKFYENPKIFGYNNELYDIKILKEKFYDLYTYRENFKEYSTIVGLYAEYLEYIKLLDKNSNVIWASRECGDGFGYDFLSYDSYFDIASVYEVKGTMYKRNLDKFSLSINEYNKYVYFNDNYDKTRVSDQIDNILIIPNKIKLEHDYCYSVTKKNDYMISSNNDEIVKVYRINNQLKNSKNM